LKPKARAKEELSTFQKISSNYDLTRKFRMVWVAQCPWVKMKHIAKGLLHVLYYQTCIDVRKKEILMGPSLNTLKQHAKQKSHKVNMLLYTLRRSTTILQQTNHCISIESKIKHIQFATLS